MINFFKFFYGTFSSFFQRFFYSKQLTLLWILLFCYGHIFYLLLQKYNPLPLLLLFLWLLSFYLSYQDMSYQEFSAIPFYLYIIGECYLANTFYLQEALFFLLPFLSLKILAFNAIGGGDLEYLFFLSLQRGILQASRELFLSCAIALVFSLFCQKKNGSMAMLPFFFIIHWYYLLFL